MVFDRDPHARAVAFELRERKHARLRRRKNDLVCRCVCSRRKASVGTTIKVTGLHDCEHSVELRLEAEEEGLDMVTRRLEGRGLPSKAAAGEAEGGRGDLLVEVHLMPSQQRQSK